MIRSLARWIKGDKKPPKYFTIIKKKHEDEGIETIYAQWEKQIV